MMRRTPAPNGTDRTLGVFSTSSDTCCCCCCLMLLLRDHFPSSRPLALQICLAALRCASSRRRTRVHTVCRPAKPPRGRQVEQHQCSFCHLPTAESTENMFVRQYFSKKIAHSAIFSFLVSNFFSALFVSAAHLSRRGQEGLEHPTEKRRVQSFFLAEA